MLLNKVKRLFADGPEVVHECRACGASLDADDETCPECGSSEKARFEIQ